MEGNTRPKTPKRSYINGLAYLICQRKSVKRKLRLSRPKTSVYQWSHLEMGPTNDEDGEGERFHMTDGYYWSRISRVRSK